jgi:membrane dipeptidase
MPPTPIIVDSHEDLAYSALSFGRDYRRAAAETRHSEVNSRAPELNGQTMLGWPDYQQARVALVFGSLFIAQRTGPVDWDAQLYHTPAEAHQLWEMQVQYYQRLVGDSPDQFQQVATRADLQRVLAAWETPAPQGTDTENPHPVGLVMLMENAEGLGSPGELEEWAAQGLRIVGPVWAPDGERFCGGKNSPQGFSREGLALLDVMAGLGLALDLSHMNERSALQAADRYEGPLAATHANCRALLRPEGDERHLTDASIRRLIERNGVMGISPFARWLRPNWSASDPRECTTLEHLAAHIDHVCQLAGDAHHVGLCTDFDGGWGWPEVPAELNTIADLPRLGNTLATQGYTPEDVAAVLGGNWIRFLERALPTQ